MSPPESHECSDRIQGGRRCRAHRRLRLFARADAEGMRRHLFHLSKDPLPYRKVNFTRPGQTKNSLRGSRRLPRQYAPRVWVYRRAGTRAGAGLPLRHHQAPLPLVLPARSVRSVVHRAQPLRQYRRLRPAHAHHRALLPQGLAQLDRLPGANDNAAGDGLQPGSSPPPRQGNPCRARCASSSATRSTGPGPASPPPPTPPPAGTTSSLSSTSTAAGARRPGGRHPSVPTIYGTPEGERLTDLLAEVNQTYDLGLAEVEALPHGAGQ